MSFRVKRNIKYWVSMRWNNMYFRNDHSRPREYYEEKSRWKFLNQMNLLVLLSFFELWKWFPSIIGARYLEWASYHNKNNVFPVQSSLLLCLWNESISSLNDGFLDVGFSIFSAKWINCVWFFFFSQPTFPVERQL